MEEKISRAVLHVYLHDLVSIMPAEKEMERVQTYNGRKYVMFAFFLRTSCFFFINNSRHNEFLFFLLTTLVLAFISEFRIKLFLVELVSLRETVECHLYLLQMVTVSFTLPAKLCAHLRAPGGAVNVRSVCTPRMLICTVVGLLHARAYGGLS